MGGVREFTEAALPPATLADFKRLAVNLEAEEDWDPTSPESRAA